MLKDILKALRVNHYIKNTIVIIPLLFSINFLNYFLWIKTIIIFAAFCAISSSVYIMNDIIDMEKDKCHPIKKFRPVTSGKIPKLYAIFLMLGLFIISIFIALNLDLLSLICILSYFILNVFYSFFLKNVPLIDVACIAMSFIIRIVGGCFAINVLPSPLVILLTFFVSMFFTFTKRKLEFQIANKESRTSIKNFNLELLNQLILTNAILSIAFYFTYVMDESTMLKAGTQYLYLTVIPFTLIVFRFLFLINTMKIADDPMHYLEKDLTIKLLCILYLFTLFMTMTLMKLVNIAGNI